LSIDCQATVNLGEYSRGGETRGDDQASDHDRGGKDKHTPFGRVDEDTGQLHLILGSSAKPSDFIVDGWYHGGEHWPQTEREAMSRLPIKADHGPESNGRRTHYCTEH
jgi:hypothetical protein